ncbi:MAG: hypothetical protein ACRC1H_00935, partial [Caldilineaceae bacterium]
GWGSFWTIVALVVAAPGVGAIVEPWMTRYRNRKVQDLTSPGSTPPSSPAARQTAPVAPMTPQVRQAPVAPVQANPSPAASAAAVPVAPLTTVAPSQVPAATVAGATVDLAAIQGTGLAASGAETSTPDLTALDTPTPATASEAFRFELPPQEKPVYQADPGMSVEDLVAAADAEAAARQDTASREAQAALAAVDTSRGDDFTRIRGLGRAAERKLKGAGVYSFAELAALPVEIVSRVLGVPVEEVIEDQIVKQANLLVVR